MEHRAPQIRKQRYKPQIGVIGHEADFRKILMEIQKDLPKLPIKKKETNQRRKGHIKKHKHRR